MERSLEVRPDIKAELDMWTAFHCDNCGEPATTLRQQWLPSISRWTIAMACEEHRTDVFDD